MNPNLSKRSVSVVIPTYKGKDLLEQNLPLLFSALNYLGLKYEVIIIDDCSGDDTVDFIRSNYPQIELMVNSANLGFSPTINKGIRAARLDLVFILNNDVQLTDNYFEKQFRYFEKETTFGVMGKIIGTGGEVQDTAKYPECSGLKIKGSTNYEFEEDQDPDFWIPSFMLSGANALIDRKKMQLLGGFDEIYAPFYWEDVDLSLRARRLGWECYYEPEAICIHPTSTTIGKHFKKKKVSIISDRNKFILHYRHLSPKLNRIYRLKLRFKFIGCLLVFRISFIKSYLAFIKILPEMKKASQQFEELALKNGIKLSLEEIHDQIINQIGSKKIRTF